MLTLDERPCKIGTQIRFRREFHGEEKVPAMDVTVLQVPLKAAELCTLLAEETAWSDLYSTSKDNPPEPKHKRTDITRKVNIGFKESSAILTLGLHKTRIAFVNCTLAKISLTPTTGGVTMMDLTIQANEEAENSDQLKQFMDTHQNVSLIFGETADESTTANDESQPELNLQVNEGDKPPEAKSPRGKRSNRPDAH
jgi:hypothetical protein